jgi:hypothetical protein
VAAEGSFEDGVVNRGEILLHVQLEGVGVTPRPTLVAVHRRVDALAAPAGVGVVDKTPVQGRFDHVHEGVMHHSVPERRGGDQTRLALVDREQPVRAGLVVACFQLALQRQQVGFQLQFEGYRTGGARFAPAGFASGPPEIIERHHLRPQAIQPLHGASSRDRSQPPICRPRSSISLAPCS